MPKWPLIVAVLIGWSVAAILGGQFLSSLVERALYPTFKVTTDVSAQGHSNTGEYRYFWLRASGRVDPNDRTAKSPLVESVMLTIVPLDTYEPINPILAMNPQSMKLINGHLKGFYTEAADDLSTHPRAAFLNWWVECGFNPDDDNLREEIDEVWKLIELASKMDVESFRMLLSQGQPTTLRISPSSWSAVHIDAPLRTRFVLSSIWILIWLAGIALLLWCIRRSSRRTERPIAS